jgi:soluble lytic murein transglycosylase
MQVLRLRYAIDSSSASRAIVRRDLLATLAAPGTGVGVVREGVALFDTLYPVSTAAEEHSIARAMAHAGGWTRAAQAFARAARTETLTSRDRFLYGTALTRLNRDAEAAAQFAKVRSPISLVAAAKYQRARMRLVVGDRGGADRLLRTIVETYRADTSAAAALALRADLASDAGDDAMQRRLLVSLTRRFPGTRFAEPARFDAAMASYVLGDYHTAQREFRALAAASRELAARYWAGRAADRLGDTTTSHAAWRAVLESDSTSYYATLAASRLGIRSMPDVRDTLTIPSIPSVDSALLRIAILRARAMMPEVRYENDQLYADAMADTAQLLAIASAFAGTDQSGRAIALGRRAAELHPRASSTLYRLIYPLASRTTIVEQAKASTLDPILIAALIRQESNFNPRALSPAGARGLMQLMPGVSSGLAAKRGIQSWSTDSLYNPVINITLGVAHLAPLVRAQPDIARALAAYNAGESRVVRWSQKRGADDPEVFTERIPFAETRGYVKSILRNR